MGGEEGLCIAQKGAEMSPDLTWLFAMVRTNSDLTFETDILCDGIS